jgi:hypothetical protein
LDGWLVGWLVGWLAMPDNYKKNPATFCTSLNAVILWSGFHVFEGHASILRDVNQQKMRLPVVSHPHDDRSEHLIKLNYRRIS